MFIDNIDTVTPPSTAGWVEIRLTQESINRLKDYIEYAQNNKQDDSSHLAGNISEELSLLDVDNWFFQEIILPAIDSYESKFDSLGKRVPLEKFKPYTLMDFWVNYQNKYEFNPLHGHRGVYSFALWFKVPTSWKEEHNLPFSKHSANPCSSDFSFAFNNILGQPQDYYYRLDKSMEGTMLLFPSNLRHQVFPFYTSDNPRISIAGNIGL